MGCLSNQPYPKRFKVFLAVLAPAVDMSPKARHSVDGQFRPSGRRYTTRWVLVARLFAHPIYRSEPFGSERVTRGAGLGH